MVAGRVKEWNRERWLAPAKVNLWLRVTGRREDGYHLLDSLMVPVDLCDKLEIAARRLAPAQTSSIAVSTDGPEIPIGRDNLAWRAAECVLAACGASAEVAIRIEKRIPHQAGLGGGSSNAAVVIKALNALLELGLSRQRLAEIGLGVGADVPFFIWCQPAHVRGIGEEVTPFRLAEKLALVIAVPEVRVSTAWAFRELDASLTTRSSARNLYDSEVPAWRGPSSMRNDLEEIVKRAFPEIGKAKEALLAAGAAGAVMSGSGSAVVGLARSLSDARDIAARIAAGGSCRAYPVCALRRQPARVPLGG